MIDFQTVTKEFRSLVVRRHELVTFLGSVFAASGVFLENTLHGGLPSSLSSLQTHLFLFYSLILLVPCLILSLRIARLHAGMTLNGMLYARLIEDQKYARKNGVEHASRHNWFGVTYLQFLLADFLAAFSASVMALALLAGPLLAVLVGFGVFLLLNLLYLRFHIKAVRIARAKIASEEREAFDDQDWLDHISASLQDANQGLIANLGFVGLILFSVFEVISGFGKIEIKEFIDHNSEHILKYGPLAYSILMLVACLAGLVINLRLRVAVGRFSLDLDPSDRPFRPFRLTDSFLGYLLLCFFNGLAVHIVLIESLQGLPIQWIYAIDGLTFLVILLAEPFTLIAAGRKSQTSERPLPKLVPVDDPPQKPI